MAQQTLRLSPMVTHDGVEMGSERSFGLVFAALFVIISLWPLAHGNDLRLWALASGTGFLTLALALPEVLRPLNILWFRLGLLIGRVMTPVVMAAIFLLTVVPVGLAMRAAGKDVLRLSRRPDLKSYWITRDSPGPERGSMKRQF